MQSSVKKYFAVALASLAGILSSAQAHAALTITAPADQTHMNLSGFSISFTWSSSVSLISLTPYVNGIAQSCLSGICSGTGGTFDLDTSNPPLNNGYCVYVLHLRGTDGFFNYDSQDLVFYDSTPGKTYASCQGVPTRCGGNQAAAPQMGGPVDLATGKMYYETEDLRIDGPLPMVFTRRFNHARAAENGPLGYGWTHGFNWSIRTYAGGYILRNDEGRDIYFSNTWSGIVGNRRDHLSFALISGGYRVTDKNQTKWTFTNTTGKLTEIRDRNNNTLTLIYDGIARLSTVTDLFGRTFTFSYDASNRIQSVTDGTRTVNFTLYDVNGNLRTVQDATGKNWNYAYTDAAHIHNLTSITDPLSHVAEGFTYSAGDQVQVFQKDSGNEQLTFSYVSATQTQVTNSAGAVTTATLDPLNGVATTITGPGCTECQGGNNVSYTLDPNFNKTQTTDANGNITRRTFDSQGNVLTETDAFGTGIAKTTTYTYNGTFNSVATVTEPSVDTAGQNRVQTNTYDTNGNLTQSVLQGYSNGSLFSFTTTRSYDSHGQMLTYDGPRTDVSDVTTYAYYSDTNTDFFKRGRLHTITNPLNQVATVNAYAISGAKSVVTDENGVETDYCLDNLDRVCGVTVKGATAAEDLASTFTLNDSGFPITITLPAGNSYGMTYDRTDRLKQVSDVLGNKSISSYDLQGRLTREETQDSGSTVRKFTNYLYDNFDRVQYIYFNATIPPAGGSIYWQFGYDNYGNVSFEKDPNGHLTCYDYDARNRRSKRHQYLGTPPASCGGSCTGPACTDLQTQYGYDSQNHLISFTDPAGSILSFKVDDAGRTWREISPDRGTTNYSFDPANNQLTRTNANGTVETRTYDALNRVISVTYPDASQNISVSYDQGAFGIGQRTGMTDPAGSSAFAFDRFGRIIQETRTPAGSTSFFTKYGYDKNSNLTGMNYPSGRTVALSFNGADQISLVSALVNGSSTTLANNFSYLPFGSHAGNTLGNGHTDTRTYDSRYRIATWTLGTLVNKGYTWQDDDNPTAITDSLAPANSRSFTFDALHRLTGANGPWGTGSYTYDTAGNRLTKVEGATAVTYAYSVGTNRIASSTGSEIAAFSYDSNGNILGDGAHTYQFSQRDRLASVDSGSAYTNSYDGDGKRVRKTVGAGTTLYFYDREQRIIEEYNPVSGQGIDYLWLPDEDEPLARVDFSLSDADNGNVLRCSKSSPNEHLDWTLDGTSSLFTIQRSSSFAFTPANFVAAAQTGKTFDDPVLVSATNYAWKVFRRTLTDTLYYYHNDHNGTPTLITNAAGAVVWKAEYLPFGDISSLPVSTISNSLRFSGQYYDSEAGLAQNHFRDYSARLGRYYEYDPYESSELNRYEYVSGNPLSYVDPLGLKKRKKGKKGGCSNPPCDASVPAGGAGKVALTCFGESSAPGDCDSEADAQAEKRAITDSIYNRVSDPDHFYDTVEGELGSGTYRGYHAKESQKSKRQKNAEKSPPCLPPGDCKQLKDCIDAANASAQATKNPYTYFNQKPNPNYAHICDHYFHTNAQQAEENAAARRPQRHGRHGRR